MTADAVTISTRRDLSNLADRLNAEWRPRCSGLDGGRYIPEAGFCACFGDREDPDSNDSLEINWMRCTNDAWPALDAARRLLGEPTGDVDGSGYCGKCWDLGRLAD